MAVKLASLIMHGLHFFDAFTRGIFVLIPQTRISHPVQRSCVAKSFKPHPSEQPFSSPFCHGLACLCAAGTPMTQSIRILVRVTAAEPAQPDPHTCNWTRPGPVELDPQSTSRTEQTELNPERDQENKTSRTGLMELEMYQSKWISWSPWLWLQWSSGTRAIQPVQPDQHKFLDQFCGPGSACLGLVPRVRVRLHGCGFSSTGSSPAATRPVNLEPRNWFNANRTSQR